ncbi:hypothetical protein FRC09_009473 [Ceratobasidium sp. 395]|nr:hypothetical protein FRC09_009473 [Ceratobasidium sp. 395]
MSTTEFTATVSSAMKEVAGDISTHIGGSIAPFVEDMSDLFDDMLLNPLKGFISTTSWSEIDPSDNSISKNAHSAIGSSLLALSSSSGRALQCLKGLEIHVKELCAAWADQLQTGCFRLSRIECFREKTGAHHEYLVAKIASGTSLSDEANGLWLRLERRPKAMERLRDYMPGLVGRFEADDIITISRQKNDLLYREDSGDEFRASMTFHEGISLGYILEVLKIIHEESYTYHIMGANCWFFASVIIEVLQSKAHGIWEQDRQGWRDHQLSKNYVNWGQYRAIFERIEGLDM